MADLSRDRRVAALDLIGPGKSEGKSCSDWNVTGLAGAVPSALQALGQSGPANGHYSSAFF